MTEIGSTGNRKPVEIWASELEATVAVGPQSRPLPLKPSDERIVRLFEELVELVGTEKVDEYYQWYLDHGCRETDFKDIDRIAVGVAYLRDAYELRDIRNEVKRRLTAGETSEEGLKDHRYLQIRQMMDARYYTPREAAEVLGTDDEQVLGWIHSGELVASNVARVRNGKRPRWRIAEADLGRFLLSRRHPASQATKTTRRHAIDRPKQYVCPP